MIRIEGRSLILCGVIVFNLVALIIAWFKQYTIHDKIVYLPIVLNGK